VNGLLANRTADGGWFMYQPDSEPIFSSSSPAWPVVRQGLVWLVAVLVWTYGAYRLFRSSTAETGDDTGD